MNLTQHPATPEQVAAGVEDLQEGKLALLQALLTFEHLPERWEIEQTAVRIADLCTYEEEIAAEGYERTRLFVYPAAMIGGAPFLMEPLAVELRKREVRVLYAFSKRESVEKILPDGRVEKTGVFKHAGFVEG